MSRPGCRRGARLGPLRSRPKKGTVAAGSSRERQLGLVARELRSRRDRPSATQSPKDRHKGSGVSGYAVPAVDEVEDTSPGASPPFSEPATPYAKSNGREIASTFHALCIAASSSGTAGRATCPALVRLRPRFLRCPRAPRDAPLTAGLFPRVAACGSRHTHVVIQGRTPVVSSRTVGTRSNSGCCLTTRQAVTRRAGAGWSLEAFRGRHNTRHATGSKPRACVSCGRRDGVRGSWRTAA